MPPIKTDASAGSSTANNETNPSSSGGNQTQKSQEQLVAEYKAEAERKQELIEELRETQQSTQAELAELRQLVESGNATKAEERKFQALGQTQDDYEAQLAVLESDPKNKLGYLSIDRRIGKATAAIEQKVADAVVRGEHNALARLQIGLLQDTADELGMDYDKFVKQLKPIASQYQFDNEGNSINIYRKAQLSIRKFKSELQAKKESEAARTKEAESNASRESGTRSVREPSSLDNRDKRLKPGNFGDEMKALGL